MLERFGGKSATVADLGVKEAGPFTLTEKVNG